MSKLAHKGKWIKAHQLSNSNFAYDRWMNEQTSVTGRWSELDEEVPSLSSLAPLRHADGSEIAAYGVDRKWPAHDQIDANDPKRAYSSRARELVD